MLENSSKQTILFDTQLHIQHGISLPCTSL